MSRKPMFTPLEYAVSVILVALIGLLIGRLS